MRPIGFSTGALAYADFRAGLKILMENEVSVVELSALRQVELLPLVAEIDSLDISSFSYISFHAPSRIQEGTEREVVRLLSMVTQMGWPVIVHPDIIGDFRLWETLGDSLFIENMDKRKQVGRTASELAPFFERFPKASLCLDLGHARQIDPTMSEAALIIERFGDRLGQLHMSEVNSRSTHDPLTTAALLAFRRVAHLIPEQVPIILESPVARTEVKSEIQLAQTGMTSTEEQYGADLFFLPQRARA